MKNFITFLSSSLLLIAPYSFSLANQSDSDRLAKIEESLKNDIPRILCIDTRFATGAQPADSAFDKLAQNGFKSILNLRTAAEGVDLDQQKALTEKAGMRYIWIPVVSSAPKPEQAEEFIKAVKDTANHPMLIHCASANRVGAFWMIYRVLEQGWSEDKALTEAEQIGLRSPALKQFAHDYITTRPGR